MPTVKIGLQTQGNQNTGKNKYNLKPDIIKAWMLVPRNFQFMFAPGDSDVTIQQGILAALTALGINNSYSARSQFIGPLESLNDKTTDATYQTYGFGRMILTDQGKYIFEYIYLNGGFEYHQKVLSFLGKTDQYKIIGLGHQGDVYGTRIYDPATGNVIGMQGLTLAQFDPVKWKISEKDKVAEYKVVIGLDSVDEFNKDVCIIATGLPIIPLLQDNNVQDVQLTAIGNGAAGVYTVNVALDSLRINIGSGDAAIGLTAACLSVKRQSTLAVIPITSIAVVGPNVAITVNTSNANYLAGANVIISLTSVATVYGVVGGYYESQTGGLVMHD